MAPKAPPVTAPPPPAAPPAPAAATTPPTPPAAPPAPAEASNAEPLLTPPPVPDAPTPDGPSEPTSQPVENMTADAAQEAGDDLYIPPATSQAPNGGTYASDAKVPTYGEDVGDIKANDPLRPGKLSAIAFKRGRRGLKLGERRKSLNDGEWQAFLDAYARGVEQGEADGLTTEQRLARIERLYGLPTPGAVVYGEGE